MGQGDDLIAHLFVEYPNYSNTHFCTNAAAFSTLPSSLTPLRGQVIGADLRRQPKNTAPAWVGAPSQPIETFPSDPSTDSTTVCSMEMKVMRL